MTFPGISHQLEISLGVQTYLPLVLIAHFQKILRQQHPLWIKIQRPITKQFLSLFGNTDINPLGNVQNTTSFGTFDTYNFY